MPKARWSLIALEEFRQEPQAFKRQFSEVIEERRTNRSLAPIDLQSVAYLVRLVAKRHEVLGEGRHARARKASISAGGLHPVDIVVAAGPSLDAPLVYDDASDLFGLLDVRDQSAFQQSTSRLLSVVPTAQGHLIAFAGHIERISAMYECPAPLLWRDAGALEQCLAMAAHALGLAYCPLGALPTDLLAAIRGESEQVVGVACGVIGLAVD